MKRVLCILINFLLFTLIECQMESKIVGGQYSQVQNFPHSAFLSIVCHNKDTNKRQAWTCGASILNQRILLTAAHCLYNCGPRSIIKASVGQNDNKVGLSTECTAFLTHENYTADEEAYDIAIVKLNKKLKFNNKVKRVALMKHPPYDEAAVTAGWGYINEFEETRDTRLKHVPQYVWKRKDCKKLIKELPEGTFCASSGNNSYPSLGDSGGALVVRGYIQIGIVSYKIKARRDVVVYQDTGYFYDWIREHAERVYCSSK